MKKVRLIHHMYLSAPNGANTVMNSLLASNRQFARNGIEITVLSPDSFAPRSFSPEAQARLKYSFRTRIKNVLKEVTRFSALAADVMLFMTDISPAKKIVKAYLRSCPDRNEIAFFHSLLPCYYFLRKNRENQRAVLVCHTNGDNFKMQRIYYPALKRSIVYKWLLKTEQYVIRHVDRINFVAEFSAKNFIALHPEVDQQKVSFIYNGVPDTINASRTRSKTDVIEFCCVASINRRKGQHLIIEALKRFPKSDLPKVHFTFVGDGSDRQSLSNEVVRSGLSDFITFAGVSQNVDEFLVNSDAFILPSEDEGLPMAIIEAMRASLPIVSTRVGGIPEMIEDKVNGLLIQPCSEDIFIILNSLEDYCWVEMGECARRTFEDRFTVEKMVDDYSKLLTI